MGVHKKNKALKLRKLGAFFVGGDLASYRYNDAELELLQKEAKAQGISVRELHRRADREYERAQEAQRETER